MYFVTGDILSEFKTPCTNKLLVFTANSVLKADQRLVMGAGIAKAVRDRYPGVDTFFGKGLAKHALMKPESHDKYGLLRGVYHGQSIAALQTKYNWKNDSPLDLIEYSLDKLVVIAREYDEVHMTIPGCGNGGLSKEHVMPLLDRNWQTNVFIWEL